MQVPKEIRQQIVSHVDDERLISLLSKLIQIESYVEKEAAELEIAEYLQKYWTKMGMKVFVQDVPQLDESLPPGPHPQIFGLLKGKGDGPRLLLGGHIDTESPIMPELWTKDPYSGYIDREEEGSKGKGYIYGLGAVNMKQSIASFTEAVHAIIESGVTLKGDLLLGGWSVEDLGCIGSRYLLKHWDEIGVGSLPDMVIDGEGSDCGFRSLHTGVQTFTVTTKGRLSYISHRFIRRPEYEGKEPINAFDKMRKVISELEKVSQTFTYTRHWHLGHPFISIGAVRTRVHEGRPCMGIGECQVDFDLRTLPGMTRETIEADLDWALYRLMIEDPQLNASFKLWPHSTGPFELPRSHMLFQVFREAHKEVFGDDLIVDIDAKGTSLNRMIDRCKYGETDMGNFHAIGIPGCLYGPGEASTTPDERVSIPQLVKHCKVTALVSAAICNAP